MSSRVISLDPSRQKLYIPPDDPLPQFYPTPRVLMVTPIYDTPVPPQGMYGAPSGSPREHRRSEEGYASSEHSASRGVYTDSEWEDARRRDMDGYRDQDSRSRGAHQRHDHWWSRHRRSPRSDSRSRSSPDSEDSYARSRRHEGSHRPYTSSRRHDGYDDEYDDDDDESDGGYSSGPVRDGYANRSRPNGQVSTHPTYNVGHINPVNSAGRVAASTYTSSQAHGNVPSQNHQAGFIPSQAASHGYVPSHSSSRSSQHGYIPSHTSSQSNQHGYIPPHAHASSQNSAYHQPAPNPQQLMMQLGQQELQSHASQSGKRHKPGFFAGLAQSALGHALSQGQSQPYTQHTASHAYGQPHGGRAPSNVYSQQNDPLAGLHLPAATQALLHYAQDKGILDDLSRYFKVLPPHPSFCYSKCTGRKKAVCIGINYVGQRDELKGCANDARNMRDFLINNYGFKSQDILMLIDDDSSHGRGQLRPTRKEMFNAMTWLVKGAQQHDSLFFHYSGHGGQSPDASGKEVDGMDEVIFPVDYDDRHNDDGPSDIIDDELHETLVHNLPPGVRLTALFDSCHSGTVLDLPYLHSAHGRLRSLGHVSKRAQKRGGADAGDVICFAACKDDETSADTREGSVAVGAMSWAFIQALERNRNQTYEELLQHLRATLIPKYHQKAQISGTHPVDLHRQFTL